MKTSNTKTLKEQFREALENNDLEEANRIRKEIELKELKEE
jgi:protein-arginine kinase activator protein McsA